MQKNIFSERLNVKPYEYPNLIEFADAINHAYWLVSEYNFDSDIQEFKVVLDDKQREAIKRCMLAISNIEAFVKPFWGNLYNRMPKPEIGVVGSTFADSEARHMRAYSELLEVLGLNKEFDKLLEVPQIKNRVKYLKKYLSGARDKDNKIYTKTLILFSLFIEHVSLFSQFYIMLAFKNKKNLLHGLSNVIDATSLEEECFKPETEILTPSGWKRVDSFKEGDPIFQYNLTEGTISKTNVIRTTKKYFEGDLVNFKKTGHSVTCTPNHRIVYLNHKREAREKAAIDFNGDSKKYVPQAGMLIGTDSINFSFEHMLRIAIQADGSKLYWIDASGEKKRRGKDGGYNFSITIYKERKKQRLEWILDNLNIEYVKKNTRDNLFCYKFYYDDKGIDFKTFDWVNLDEISVDWALKFCYELSEWDGYKVTDNVIGYSSTNKSCIDKAQCVAILAGYSTNIIKRTDNRKESYKDSYKLYIKETDFSLRSHSLKKSFEYYDGDVYCVSVPSGVIITRENDKTFIVGNCHGNFGIALIDIIREENPEWFDDDITHMILSACKKAYKAELGIIDWIFEKGELDFVPKQEVISFIEDRFNRTLIASGFSKDGIFDVSDEDKEKFEWFYVITGITKEPDFFNKRPNTYNKFSKSVTSDDLF